MKIAILPLMDGISAVRLIELLREFENVEDSKQSDHMPAGPMSTILFFLASFGACLEPELTMMKGGLS